MFRLLQIMELHDGDQSVNALIYTVFKQNWFFCCQFKHNFLINTIPSPVILYPEHETDISLLSNTFRWAVILSETQQPNCRTSYVPLVSSIGSELERSGCRRGTSPRPGSPGPRTEPPSADIPAWAAQTSSRPTECSQPGRSWTSCRTEWTGEASSSSGSRWASGAERRDAMESLRSRSVRRVGPLGARLPNTNWFLLPTLNGFGLNAASCSHFKTPNNVDPFDLQ